MSTQSKKQFMDAPKRRGLSQQQKAAAWQQHLNSKGRKAGGRKPPQSSKQQKSPRVRQGNNGQIGADRSGERRQIQPGMRMGRPVYRTGMSECARLYAAAVVNPFSFLDSSLAGANKTIGISVNQEKLACVPNFPTIKTYRLIAWTRGTFNTSSVDGTGFLAMTPRRICNDYTLANTRGNPLFHGDGTSPFPVFPNLDGLAPPSGVVGESFNTPWAVGDAAVASPMTYRVVGAGLRVRYAGTELNRGGIIHCLEEPNHSSMSGLGVPDLASYDGYFRVPVTRDWTTMVYTPVDPSELNLLSETFAESAGSDLHYMGMLIAAASGVSSLFEFEAVSLFEASGPLIRGAVYSETDMRGFEMVQNVMKTENQLVLQESGPSGIYKMIMDGAAALTSMAPMAKAVGGVVGAMLL